MNRNLTLKASMTDSSTSQSKTFLLLTDHHFRTIVCSSRKPLVATSR
jgi:hypothetical protein